MGWWRGDLRDDRSHQALAIDAGSKVGSNLGFPLRIRHQVSQKSGSGQCRVAFEGAVHLSFLRTFSIGRRGLHPLSHKLSHSPRLGRGDAIPFFVLSPASRQLPLPPSLSLQGREFLLQPLQGIAIVRRNVQPTTVDPVQHVMRRLPVAAGVGCV